MLKCVEISQLARSKTLLHSLFSFSSHPKSVGNRSVDTHIAPHSFQYCRKPLAGTHRTSYRRKVEENPTLLLELKPYSALGTVMGAQSSKLSMLPVNKLIVLYVVFKLDESYTPSKVSILAGDGFHNLKEIKTVELVKPTGWVYLSLSGAYPR
ncbi:Anaphase-promoting complex subunit 10 [Glycine max]|nr:Anaphase-promoting complex subunit 10 [Glycine max]